MRFWPGERFRGCVSRRSDKKTAKPKKRAKRTVTPAAARMAIFEFIEGWYNPTRRHSSLGRISPVEFERRHSTHHERAVTHRPGRAVAYWAPAPEPVDNRL